MMNARHCLWISRPGFWRFFKNSTKSLDTWSVSKLAWRLTDGLVVLPSWVSDEQEKHLENKILNIHPLCVCTLCLHEALKPSVVCYAIFIPFLEAVRDEGLKNFLTVVTFLVFSFVFFSSNLEKAPREACPGGVVWEWVCTPWLLAYAASSSRCNLEPWKSEKQYGNYIMESIENNCK